jgi:hypothetical protein
MTIVAGLLVVAAFVLSTSASLAARRSRRRRAGQAFGALNVMRSPSGRPFFPETPEEQRRAERVLSDWDPTFGDADELDPDRW